MEDYFVEFLHYELTLKQQEKFKYLIAKHKDIKETLLEFKSKKINTITKFLEILDNLEVEIKNLKKLLPKQKEETKTIKKTTKKQIKHKKEKPKQKKKSGELEKIKLDLEKIKDELENI